MTSAFRASFDPFFYRFDFGFASPGQALRYLESFGGEPVLQSQAIHEVVHLLFSGSPVTRALRLLRSKALTVLVETAELAARGHLDKVDQAASFRALTQWRIAEATIQALLPIYEGTALMGEFDSGVVPAPARSDGMPFLNIWVEQAKATLDERRLQWPGRHQEVGVEDEIDAAILDVASEHLLHPDIVNRKQVLLNMPLMYERPSDCYLVAWLFVRQVHEHLSAVLDTNVNPTFVIKYLRSFFFEDWELVELILKVAHWEVETNSEPLQHIRNRLRVLAQDFTKVDYDAYRAEIVRLLALPGENMEFLPGIRLNIPPSECHRIAMSLFEASLHGLVDDALSERQREISLIIQQFLNREAFATFYEGVFDVLAIGSDIAMSAEGHTVILTPVGQVQFESQQARATFHLAMGGDNLGRVIRIHLREGIVTATLRGAPVPAEALMAEINGAFETAEETAQYIGSMLLQIQQVFHDKIEVATREGCISGRNLILNWLEGWEGFCARLFQLSSTLKFPEPPRATFARLFRGFMNEEVFLNLVKHSLAYGIGYNVGTLAQGEAVNFFLAGRNFHGEIEAQYKIRDATGLEFPFFYVEEADGDRQIPRFYF
jgi:hypothetical protein